MAKRLTFSRNSLRSNVHPWTKQKWSPQVHRTLSPRTTRPSPSRRFRSQPCSAIYVNYQRTKLQLCRMDSQTGFSKQLPQQLPDLLRTSSFSQWKHTRSRLTGNTTLSPRFSKREATNNYLPTIGPCPFFPLSARFWITYRAPFFSSISRNTTCMLSNQQFGFRASLSTTKQLVYITHQWISNLNSKKDTLAVFMDFHKAFDRVWHNGLLYQIGQLGISHSALSWLQDYLTNRTLSVNVGQSHSPDYQLSAGVPQGSHLGPVLFLAYINDLPTVVTSPAGLYADDALLHDTVEQASTLQRNINAAVTWATTWRGGFSAAKTILLHIGNCNRSGDHTLDISGQPLQAQTPTISIWAWSFQTAYHGLTISTSSLSRPVERQAFCGTWPQTCLLLFPANCTGPGWDPRWSMPALYGMPASARRTPSHSRGSKPALHGGLVVVSLLCVVNKAISRAELKRFSKSFYQGAQSAPQWKPCSPSKNLLK